MLAVATLGPTTLAAYAPVGPTDGAAAGPGLNARAVVAVLFATTVAACLAIARSR